MLNARQDPHVDKLIEESIEIGEPGTRSNNKDELEGLPDSKGDHQQEALNVPDSLKMHMQRMMTIMEHADEEDYGSSGENIGVKKSLPRFSYASSQGHKFVNSGTFDDQEERIETRSDMNFDTVSKSIDDVHDGQNTNVDRKNFDFSSCTSRR